jgi:hypothetical protein
MDTPGMKETDLDFLIINSPKIIRDNYGNKFYEVFDLEEPLLYIAY